MRIDDAPWHAALADADAAAAAARASQQSAAAAEVEEAAAAEDAEDDDDGINPFDEERAAGWLQTSVAQHAIPPALDRRHHVTEQGR